MLIKKESWTVQNNSVYEKSKVVEMSLIFLMYFMQILRFHALYPHYKQYLTTGNIKFFSMNCSTLLAHGIYVSVQPFIGEICFLEVYYFSLCKP